MTTPSWEASKENVSLIKNGRKIESLVHNIVCDRQSFELQLKQAENVDDKLFIYSKYLKQIKQENVANSSETIIMLERITLEFQNEESIKNNIVYVKLWIEYVSTLHVLTYIIYSHSILFTG